MPLDEKKDDNDNRNLQLEDLNNKSFQRKTTSRQSTAAIVQNLESNTLPPPPLFPSRYFTAISNDNELVEVILSNGRKAKVRGGKRHIVEYRPFRAEEKNACAKKGLRTCTIHLMDPKENPENNEYRNSSNYFLYLYKENKDNDVKVVYYINGHKHYLVDQEGQSFKFPDYAEFNSSEYGPINYSDEGVIKDILRITSERKHTLGPEGEETVEYYPGLTSDKWNAGKQPLYRAEGIYNWDGSLGGRGQDGVADFFKQQISLNDQPGKEYVIKQDKPGTCVLEAATRFIEQFLPKIPHGQNSPVNFAEACQWLERDPRDSTKTKAPIAITVQARLTGYQPWVKIMGKERNPKQFVSFELLNAQKIKNSIHRMTPAAKSELAAAIYASELAGDESLHTGQFMVQVDSHDDIAHIVRVDFGAAGRFAEERMKNKDHLPGQASKAYRSSGQLGKNYVSYLLQDPEVLAQYLHIGFDKKSNNPIDMAKAHRDEIVKQLDNIPQSLRSTAVRQIYDTFAKKTKTAKFRAFVQKLLVKIRKPSEKDVLDLAEKTTKHRIEQLQEKRKEMLAGEIEKLQEICGGLPNSHKPFKVPELRRDQTTRELLDIDFSSCLEENNFKLLHDALILKMKIQNSLESVRSTLYHLDAYFTANLRPDFNVAPDPIREQQRHVIADMRHNFEIRENCIELLETYQKSLNQTLRSKKNTVMNRVIDDAIFHLRSVEPGNQRDRNQLIIEKGILNHLLGSGDERAMKLCFVLRELIKPYRFHPAQPTQTNTTQYEQKEEETRGRRPTSYGA